MATLEQRLQAVEQTISNSRITPNLPSLNDLVGDELLPIWSNSLQDTAQYPLANLVGGGGASAINDVIPVFRTIYGIDYSSTSGIPIQIASIINASTSFEKTQNQFLIFVTLRIGNGSSVFTQNISREYYIFTGVKGNYGSGATQISPDNIVFFVTDKDDSRANAIFNLGEIGDTSPIQDEVNTSGPYDPSVAQLILFQATRSGIKFDFLYVGQITSQIGSNETQTTLDDFINLNTANPDSPPKEGGIDTSLDINSTNAVTNQAITFAIQNIAASKNYFDDFTYKTVTVGNFAAYVPVDEYEMVLVESDLFFLIKLPNALDVSSFRINVLANNEYEDLSLPSSTTIEYKAYALTNGVLNSNLILTNSYRFTFWILESSIITETSELINDGQDGLNPFIDEVEQEVLIGGVYNNFQVEGNIIVATNTDGKAVFTGFNVSDKYKILYLINNSDFEIQIDNENSSSLEENQIKLPNNVANVGLQGTTVFAYITKGGLNKWQIIDVFGSRYMPEHQGLDQDAAVVVGEGSVSRSKQIVNLYESDQSITSSTLTDAELNIRVPGRVIGFELICENAGDNGIVYKLINDTTGLWKKFILT